MNSNSENLRDTLRAIKEAGLDAVINLKNNEIRIIDNTTPVQEDPEKERKAIVDEDNIGEKNISARKPKGQKWSNVYLKALQENRKPGEIYDDKKMKSQPKQHISKEKAEELIAKLEGKILTKETSEWIFKDLTELTYYLYDTYDYNYNSTQAGTDPMGSFVYNIENAIIGGISVENTKINVEEIKKIIELIKKVYGNVEKIDTGGFLDVVTMIAFNPNSKELIEIVTQLIGKFKNVAKIHKEGELFKYYVTRIDAIINKFKDTSVLEKLVLAVEDNDIGAEDLDKKILLPILNLSTTAYHKLKEEKVPKNEDGVSEISTEDFIAMLENYTRTKFDGNKAKKSRSRFSNAKNKFNKRRRIKAPIRGKRKNIRLVLKGATIVGAAGLIVAGLKVGSILLTRNNKPAYYPEYGEDGNTDLDGVDDIETSDALKPKLPEAMQEENKKYLIIQYKDLSTGEKIPAYVQLERGEYEIPEWDNSIITSDKVIENVDKSQIIQYLTMFTLNDNKVLTAFDGTDIEDGDVIYVILYDQEATENGEKNIFIYFDENNNIHTGIVSQKDFKKLEKQEEYLVEDFPYKDKTKSLSTKLPTFFTAESDITCSDGTIIIKGQTFPGFKKITQKGEVIDIIKFPTFDEIQKENESLDGFRLISTRIENENVKEMLSSLDKYKPMEVSLDDISDLSSRFYPIAEGIELEDDLDLYNLYISSNTKGQPEYTVEAGTVIDLYKHPNGYVASVPGVFIEYDETIQGEIDSDDDYVRELIEEYDIEDTEKIEEYNIEDTTSSEAQSIQDTEPDQTQNNINIPKELQGNNETSLPDGTQEENVDSQTENNDLDMSSFDDLTTIYDEQTMNITEQVDEEFNNDESLDEER